MNRVLGVGDIPNTLTIRFGLLSYGFQEKGNPATFCGNSLKPLVVLVPISFQIFTEIEHELGECFF